MEINIKWKVLDGTTEGPLTWVKIGVPNYHCKDIKSLTSNIQMRNNFMLQLGSLKININNLSLENY